MASWKCRQRALSGLRSSPGKWLGRWQSFTTASELPPSLVCFPRPDLRAAKTRLLLWYIDRDNFKGATRQAVQEKQARMVAFLSVLPLLEGLSKEYYEAVADLCIEVQLNDAGMLTR